MKFITEVTLRNPPITAADEDEARRLTADAYGKLIEILARTNRPPQVIEIAVYPVEDTD